MDQENVRSLTIPAPVKGWNTMDPISDMDPQYCVDTENFFAPGGTVDLRNGCAMFAKEIGNSYTVSDVIIGLGTLEYGSVTKLIAFAISDHKVYDITAGGDINGSPISGSPVFGNDILFMQQFRDRIFFKSLSSSGGGNHDVYWWTGSGSVTLAVFTGPSGDDKDLGTFNAFKSRLYFAQISVPSIWYGGVDAITGALTEFPLASVFRQGITYIYFVGPVTRAKDFAEDDLLCIISNNGEVLIYQGSDPGSPTWGLIGRYSIPKPASFKSFFYVGSALHVMTRGGLISIQDVMLGASPQGIWPTLTEKIDDQFPTVFGPSIPQSIVATGITVPSARYLLLNIPIFSGLSIASIKQWVMNLTTGSWWPFTGQTIYSVAYYNDELYFGTTYGKVFKGNSGYFDENPATDAAILARTIKLRPAYNYFGDPEHVKQFVEAIPTVYQSEGLSITLDSDVDYQNTTATSTVTDLTDTSYKIYQPICGLKGIGTAASIRIDGTVTTKRISLQATKVLFKEGTIGK